LAQSGFSATARDWARLAIYTVKSLKGQNGECIKNYMEESTSPQIENKSGRIGKAFKNYGYQTWIGSFGGRHSYWWVGYGGQRVGIDPESEKIMVLTSWREDYMADAYKLFRDWTQ
jgi:CubicO group peptidase (beta-lactamase class C family)